MILERDCKYVHPRKRRRERAVRILPLERVALTVGLRDEHTVQEQLESVINAEIPQDRAEIETGEVYRPPYHRSSSRLPSSCAQKVPPLP